jgi:long-chain acyl-CoA synthetase
MNLQHMDKLLSYELLIHKGSPFELQDAVIKGIPCKVFPRGPQTLRDVFMKAASFADREFIIKEDTRLTFGQALQRGNRFARILRQKYNIKKGSRVALMAETGPEWAVSFMALCLAGAVPVVIPTDMKERDLLSVLANCEAVVAGLLSAEKIDISVIKRPVVIPVMRPSDAISYVDCEASSGFSIFNLADAPDDKNDAWDVCAAAPDDEALISFTSGTTGKPKGVVLTHRNITTGLMNMMLGGVLMSLRAANDRSRKQSPGAQPCSLLLSPFSHIGGYSQLMLMCYLGGKIVLMPGWDAQRAAALVENECVRSLCGLSPAMARDLLRANRSTDSLRSLTHLNIHGVALHRKFIRELADEFSHISLGTSYGMTETCGAVSVVSGRELLDNSELSGKALPSVNIKIVDHYGREAEQGDHGEIWVRGAMVMQGYCPVQDNSGVMLEDGWLKTGDLARIGLLMLAGGAWDGAQLVPQDYLARAASAQWTFPDGDRHVGYGYGFWLDALPQGAVVGVGLGGHYCIVLPQHGLVCAATAHGEMHLLPRALEEEVVNIRE